MTEEKRCECGSIIQSHIKGDICEYCILKGKECECELCGCTIPDHCIDKYSTLPGVCICPACLCNYDEINVRFGKAFNILRDKDMYMFLRNKIFSGYDEDDLMFYFKDYISIKLPAFMVSTIFTLDNSCIDLLTMCMEKVNNQKRK